MKITNSFKGLRSRYSPLILLTIVLSTCLLFCCSIFLLIAFIGSFIPPSFSIVEPTNTEVSTSNASQKLRFECVGIDSIKVNDQVLSAPQRGEACGNTGYVVELGEGENIITVNAIDTNSKEYSYEISITYTKPIVEPIKEPVIQQPEVKEEPVISYIDANDFKNTTYEKIVQKYGKPDTLYENEPPVVNLFNYDKGNYILEGNYLKNNTTVNGSQLFLKKKCSINNFNFDQAKEILPLVNLTKYENSKWQQVNSYFKQYRLENIDGWKSLAITCTDEGVFKIAFYGK